MFRFRSIKSHCRVVNGKIETDFKNYCYDCVYNENWQCQALKNAKGGDYPCTTTRSILGYFDCKKFEGR